MAGTFDNKSVFIPLRYVPNSVFQRLAESWGHERLLRSGVLLGDTGVGLTGKFGTVYLMRDWSRSLLDEGEKPLALKESVSSIYGILPSERLEDFLERKPSAHELWQLFYNEYDALVCADGLKGHAPKAYAFGCVRTYNEIRFAFVMDWLGDDHTRTLDQYVPPQGLSAGETAYIGALVCEALKHLHWINRSHRDLKADNIFVSTSDVVGLTGRKMPQTIKLVDLGQSGSFETKSNDYQTSTVEYCGPELFVSEQDPRYQMQNDASFDVWMIGAVLYFMRMGRDPRTSFRFDNPHFIEEKDRGLCLPGRVLREGDSLDSELDFIIRSCTKAQPSQRPGLWDVESRLAYLAERSGENWPGLPSFPSRSLDDTLV